MVKYVWLLLLGMWLSVPIQAQNKRVYKGLISQYETVRYSDGNYIVSKGGKMGVANPNGRLITKLVYDTIHNFKEGVAIIGIGKREVNQYGKVERAGKYGYINKAGKLIVPAKYEIIEDFSEGLGLVVPSLANYYWFNKNGKIVIAYGLSGAESFSGGTARIWVGKVGFKLQPDYPGQPNPFDIRGNYIDKFGRLLIPWKYDTIAPYSPGRIRLVRKNEKWGFLDNRANILVPLVYNDVDADSNYFWQGLRRVSQRGRYGFINDTTGNVVITPQYEASLASSRSIVWVKKNGLWGAINAKNQLVIPLHYQQVAPFDSLGLAVVYLNKQAGLIHETGRLITPIQYDTILDFREARAVVKRSGKFGYINTAGIEVIPVMYDNVSSFQGGKAYATRWGLFITLDQSGNWLAWRLHAFTLRIAVATVLVFLLLLWLYKRRQQRFAVSQA